MTHQPTPREAAVQAMIEHGPMPSWMAAAGAHAIEANGLRIEWAEESVSTGSVDPDSLPVTLSRVRTRDLSRGRL